MSKRLNCKCCGAKRRLHCYGICGVFSIILTIFCALVLAFNLTDELFFLIIKKELELVPDSSTLDEWETTDDSPLYKIYYFFDTQNPAEYILGDVPVVEDIGPFVYRKYDTKLNLRWNDDESLVAYNRDVQYVFVPEKSIGDPNNYTITALNVPLIVVLSQLQEVERLLFKILGPVLANAYLTMIGDQMLFVEKTAYELLWGYSDPLLEMLVSLGLTDDPLMRIDANSTDHEAVYIVNTGKNDIDSVDTFIQWNNLTEIAGWNSEDARRIYGSETRRLQPKIKKEDRPILFIEQVYRHAQLAFDNQAELYGIELYYYKNLRKMFGNMSEYPSTVAYNAYDYKYGLLNLSAIMGMPLFISKPHCLDCDPEYFKNVSGYHPCRKLHDPYSGIEPFTGITMDGSVRGQANVRIQRNIFTRQLALVRDVTMYPWFYYSLEGRISEDKADEFKSTILLPRLLLKITVIIHLCVSGLVTLLVAGVLLRSYYLIKRPRNRKDYHKSIKQSAKDYGSINQSVEDKESSNDSIKLTHRDSALVSDHEDHQTDRQSLL